MHSSSHFFHHFVHFLLAVLVIAAMCLTIPRLSMDYDFRKKENTLALTIGAKSLVFIAYQVLTEHVSRLRRWHSYKVNVYLNIFEVVAWAAVTFFVFDANVKKCSGLDCTLSWIVVVLSALITLTNVYMSWFSVREFRKYRAGRLPEDTAVQLEDTESIIPKHDMR